MSDKRKPDFIFLLRYKGKTKSMKLELFNANQFDDNARLMRGAKLYRIRSNGRWYKGANSKVYFTKWEVRDLLFKSIKI